MVAAQPRVAIVEDDAILAFMLAQTCTATSLGVAWQAETVDDAVALLKQDVPDIVILDFALDGEQDGVDLLRIVKKACPGLKTVLVTGWDFEKLEERSDFIEPDVMLQKPFLPSELVDILTRLRDNKPVSKNTTIKRRKAA